MKSLNQRVLDAKAIAKLGKVSTTDNRNRAKTTIVPGSQGTQNHGIIRRLGNVITTECRKITGAGHNDCFGNYRSICRHSLASVIMAIEYQGFISRFRRSRKDAERLAKKFSDSTVCDNYGDPLIIKIHSHSLDSRIKVRQVGNGYVSWIGKEPIFHKLSFTCIEDAINYWKDRYSIYMIVLEDLG